MKKISILQIAAFLTMFCLSLSFHPDEVKGELDMESAEYNYEHQFRDWELADGTKIRAQYISVGKNTIILRNEDYEPVILKTRDLSKEDAKFQREMWKKYHGKQKAHWNEETAQDYLDESYREWELADGTKIEARYEAVEENAILLYDIDGNYIKLKTKELSKVDIKFQKYLWQKQLKKKRKERAEERKQR